MGSKRKRPEVKEDSGRWGGVVFIGPIPIFFGDDAVKERFPGWIFLLMIGFGIFSLLCITFIVISVIV